jgi:hypothetical protein
VGLHPNNPETLAFCVGDRHWRPTLQDIRGDSRPLVLERPIRKISTKPPKVLSAEYHLLLQ